MSRSRSGKKHSHRAARDGQAARDASRRARASGSVAHATQTIVNDDMPPQPEPEQVVAGPSGQSTSGHTAQVSPTQQQEMGTNATQPTNIPIDANQAAPAAPTHVTEATAAAPQLNLDGRTPQEQLAIEAALRLGMIGGKRPKNVSRLTSESSAFTADPSTICPVARNPQRGVEKMLPQWSGKNCLLHMWEWPGAQWLRVAKAYENPPPQGIVSYSMFASGMYIDAHGLE